MLGLSPPPGAGPPEHMLRLISSMTRPTRNACTLDTLRLAQESLLHTRLKRGASYATRYTPPVPARLAFELPLKIGPENLDFQRIWTVQRAS